MTDYTKLLRLHATHWTAVFALQAVVFVLAALASMALSSWVPVLTVGAVCAVSVLVCRIRFRQLQDARDEALVRELRSILARGGEL